MCPMKYLDLSYEGRQQAERGQLDNGKMPHGGYRGTRRHPPSGLSYDKGREFKDKLDQEVTRVMTEEEITAHGRSPAWSLLVHREHSFSDESPLITSNYMAASRFAPTDGISLLNRASLLPPKSARLRRQKSQNGIKYYRPNRTHQYLTATELKDSTQQDVNTLYGRPTRTTLLRQRNKCMSASTNSYDQRREFFQKVDEIRTSCPIVPNAEYLQLKSVREAESLHSYLTGARYNRAHCLDAKSVDHSGVYMPRENPSLGSQFRGPKGQEYLKEFVETPRSLQPHRTPPSSGRRRPTTAPPPQRPPVFSAGRRPSEGHKKARKAHPRSAEDAKRKQSKLNVVGCRLPIGLGKDLSVRIAAMQRQDSGILARGDETYTTCQPPPTPNSMAPTTRREVINTVEGGDGGEEKVFDEEVTEENIDKKEESEAVVEPTEVTDEERGEDVAVEKPDVVAEEHVPPVVSMPRVDDRGEEDGAESVVDNNQDGGHNNENQDRGEEVQHKVVADDVKVDDEIVQGESEVTSDDIGQEVVEAEVVEKVEEEDVKVEDTDEAVDVQVEEGVGEDVAPVATDNDEAQVSEVTAEEAPDVVADKEDVVESEGKPEGGKAVTFFLTEEEGDTITEINDNNDTTDNIDNDNDNTEKATTDEDIVAGEEN